MSNHLKNQSKKFHLSASTFYHTLGKSKINLNMVGDALFGHHPLDFSAPTVCFDLSRFKKDKLAWKYTNSFICNLLPNILPQKQFSQRVLTEPGVTAVAVPTKHSWKLFTCCLPDNNSIYIAELRAFLLALKHVYCSKEKSF